MHESHSNHTERSNSTPTENISSPYEPDFEKLQTLGIKQLALEAAKDRLYGEGNLKDWAIAHVVAPRAYAETATGSTRTSHEQVDEQVALFEDNVNYFTNKLSGNTDTDTPAPTEAMPTVPVASDIISGEPSRVRRGLSDRLRSLAARWKGRERNASGEEDPTTAHRLLGSTALAGEQLHAENDSRFNEYATSWDDVFSQLSTNYPPAIERDIKAAVARQFLHSGQMYYKGQGEYAINPLNPPLRSEVMSILRGSVDGGQVDVKKQTMSDAFITAQQASVAQQQEYEAQQKGSNSSKPHPRPAHRKRQ
jgi:hypothetical protein